jgi:hypothetical protein
VASRFDFVRVRIAAQNKTHIVRWTSFKNTEVKQNNNAAC